MGGFPKEIQKNSEKIVLSLCDVWIPVRTRAIGSGLGGTHGNDSCSLNDFDLQDECSICR